MEKQSLSTVWIYVLSILGLPALLLRRFRIYTCWNCLFYGQWSNQKFYSNPEAYDGLQAVKTAKIIALVVVIINILYLAYFIYQLSTVGWSNILNEYQMQMKQYE